MKTNTATLLLFGLCAAAGFPRKGRSPRRPVPASTVTLPLDRTAYFIGETVPWR